MCSNVPLRPPMNKVPKMPMKDRKGRAKSAMVRSWRWYHLLGWWPVRWVGERGDEDMVDCESCKLRFFYFKLMHTIVSRSSSKSSNNQQMSEKRYRYFVMAIKLGLGKEKKKTAGQTKTNQRKPKELLTFPLLSVTFSFFESGISIFTYFMRSRHAAKRVIRDVLQGGLVWARGT